MWMSGRGIKHINYNRYQRSIKTWSINILDEYGTLSGLGYGKAQSYIPLLTFF